MTTSLSASRVNADYPEQAKDTLFNLNEHIIPHPSATYYLRAEGDSMMQLGIYDGDLLVVDRTLEPTHGDVVIVTLNGNKLCKVLDSHFQQLLAGNDLYPSIKLSEAPGITIEGVVTHSLRCHKDSSPLFSQNFGQEEGWNCVINV